jgi:small subunit ribosomal protein S16e
MSSTQSVQCFGKKKTATAVAHCRVSYALVLRNLLLDGLDGS